jgi:hypothetical protein
MKLKDDCYKTSITSSSISFRRKIKTQLGSITSEFTNMRYIRISASTIYHIGYAQFAFGNYFGEYVWNGEKGKEKKKNRFFINGIRIWRRRRLIDLIDIGNSMGCDVAAGSKNRNFPWQ